MIIIPTLQDVAAWTQRTTLEGTEYILDFNWNGRDGAWYMNISTIAGAALVCGIKLVSNRKLFRRFHHIDGMPLGELVIFDGSGSIPWPGYSELNAGVDVIYIESTDDLEAIAAGVV
jgi:hypothetical protein